MGVFEINKKTKHLIATADQRGELEGLDEIKKMNAKWKLYWFIVF